MAEQEDAMEAVEDLKARARILHREAREEVPGALSRLRAHPELADLDGSVVADRVQRKHCLWVVAREHGFRDWVHARTVLSADGQVPDFGTLLVPSRCCVHWNIWSADYDEARRIRSEHGGYLLAYRNQFLIVDEHYLETLGLGADDPDWAAIGRDWVKPLNPLARARLYARLLRGAA
ncbi:MAG: hypothetical protein OXR73_03845 [Myxococcales bacterium]|nr:hypothetical protein [Myxococcales bacterium]